MEMRLRLGLKNPKFTSPFCLQVIESKIFLLRRGNKMQMSFAVSLNLENGKAYDWALLLTKEKVAEGRMR
jgi:hypothetical protein